MLRIDRTGVAILAIALTSAVAGNTYSQPTPVQYVYGYCTQQEIMALNAQGYAAWQIQQHCSIPKPTALYCVTQAGTCALVSPVHPGSPCTCFTQWGPIHGVSQ